MARLPFLKTSCLACLPAVLCAAACADSVARPIEIPFELTGKAIWLAVRVNGSAPQHFLFDTGAGATVINRSRAAALGLKVTGDHLQANAGAGDRPTMIGVVENVTFELPQAVRISLPGAPVIALDEISRSYGVPMDGIIGSDLMARYVVEIDYDARRLVLHDPAKFTYSGSGTILPIEVERGLAYIRGTVSASGRPPVEGRFMIDSPILDAIVFTSPFDRQHRLRESVSRLLPHRSIGVGGRTRQVKGRIAALSIGPFRFALPLAHFTDDSAGAFARTDMAGATGAELLRRFRVILDYARSRVILEPNSHLAEPWPADASGMVIRCVAGDYRAYEVDVVAPQSPAAAQGIREGDRIVAVDGKPARQMQLWEIRTVLQPPGRRVTLRIAGKTGTRTVNLELRELLNSGE